VNGKYYVGQHSKSDDPQVRWRDHVNDANSARKRQRYFYNAILKYGPDAFKVEVLAYADTLEELNSAECMWIAISGSYNKEMGYNSTFGGSGMNLTEAAQQRQKQGIRNKWKEPAHREKMLKSLSDPEIIVNRIKKFKETMAEPTFNLKFREAIRKSRNTKEYQENTHKARNTEEYRKALSEGVKKSWEDPKRREKQKRKVK